jgi:hypothetical protein
MTTYEVAPDALVLGHPAYRVAVGGVYAPLDLVPCRRESDIDGPTCAFLALTVAGLDPNEVAQ